MFLFGHLGVTLGAGWLVSSVCGSELTGHRGALSKTTTLSDSETGCSNGLVRFFAGIDLRLLLLGSMLPDIIDKPLALLLPEGALRYGRTVGHTLVFLAVLTVAGMLRRRTRAGAGIMAVSLGVVAHLIMDQMWATPNVILWPALGWTFEGHSASLSRWLQMLLNNANIYVPEIAGTIIILSFVIALAYKHRTLVFIRTGRT